MSDRSPSGRTSGAVGAARLALGLLTVVPAGSVDVDRRTIRHALLLAPLVGVLLGTAAWAVGALLHAGGLGPLLAAVGAVATLAVATRALHLDGLADLADGLGSGRPAVGALAVMRRSDVGPFGVITLLLVLLTQVAALERAWEAELAGPALVLGCATGRLALLWSCRTGAPAARTDGLGVLVAGAVPVPAVAATTALGIAVAVAWGALDSAGNSVVFGLAMVTGLCCALLLHRRAVARLGGVTGDVLGAVVETATTAALVALLLAAG